MGTRRRMLAALIAVVPVTRAPEKPSALAQREPGASRVASAGVGPRELIEEPFEPVAVVLSVAGRAVRTLPPGKDPVRVAQLDWLPEGSEVEAEPGSRLVLVFANGSRYAVEGSTKVTLGATELKATTGKVHRLEPVPPMARIAPIAAIARPGTRSGALRLREEASEQIENVYPRAGCRTLPDRTMLRFAPIAGAVYKVEIEEESGRTIFAAETRATSVEISPGILKPGERYYFRVWTLGGTGPPARGESRFMTLGAEDIERRAALKVALEQSGDADSLALVAEMDRRLGLLVEARDAFRDLAARFPSHPTVRRALEELKQELQDPSP